MNISKMKILCYVRKKSVRNERIDVEQKSKLVGADPVGRESYIVLKKADNLSKGVR